MMRKVVLLIISCLISGTVWGQNNRKQKLIYETTRLGIDPIKLLSIPFVEKNNDKHRFYWRTFEINTEVIFNLKTSIVLEGGYGYTHLRLFNTTVDYFCRGVFLRSGLNYKMNPKKSNKEYGIGWRVGWNTFSENWNIRLYGNSWKTELISKDFQKGKTVWGEMLVYYLNPVSQKGLLENLKYGADIRIRFMNQNHSNTKIYGEWLPGVGPKREIIAAVHFKLVYQFSNKKIYSKLHEYL